MKPLAPVADLLSQSPNVRVRELREKLERAGPTEVPVLIVGEPGTGKELVARSLHQRSLHSEQPFCKIECELAPRSVIQAQLDELQHEWSFEQLPTLKDEDVGGREDNSPGAVFIREIHCLSLDLQTKVLALLPDGCIDGDWESGAGQTRPRILASTARDLREEVAQGRFRPEVYFGLAIVVLEIPPLRERKEDLAILADHFLQKHSRELRRQDWPRLSPQMLEKVYDYHWPGNLLELSSVMSARYFSATLKRRWLN